MTEKWHLRTIEQTLAAFQTDAVNGLSRKEAEIRLKEYGYNELKEKQRISWVSIFLAQFQDFMVLILLAATLISTVLGEYVDAITIIVIVIMNAILGFVQEYRAEQSLQALKKLSAPAARVIRNGFPQPIPARELVPGDLMIIESGDMIAADARLISAQNLETEEATLTGESEPARKTSDICKDSGTIGDRKNIIFLGTSVIKGRGTAIVCSTGMTTEVGGIAEMILEKKQDETPLERRLDYLGRWLVSGCIMICSIVAITGIIKGESILFMCMAGISLAVAAIPEGLPAIVTVALALGVQRMIKRKAIIRKLPAVETLGCTTVICSDKTGTLTQNAMTVRKIYAANRYYDVTGLGQDISGEFLYLNNPVNLSREKSLLECLRIGVLCNNSILKRHNISISGQWRNRNSDNWKIEGDPTEGALVVAAAKAHVWRDQIEKIAERVAEIPFESERRQMSVIYRQNNIYTMYTKGALDTILPLCRYYNDNGMVLPLNAEKVEQILAANDSMTLQALRVLAVAYCNIREAELQRFKENQDANNLIFCGLQGMIDPPRPEVKQAIQQCRRAGIKTVMITGDHLNTAISIAQELSIFDEKIHKAVNGVQLEAMSDDQLAKEINGITVYARVSPVHKLRIVKALRKNRHIVAMTGDGVNDAPAIKEADIGIAMGRTGTDVTKEASSMILADDNFATIVAAVEEGRGIYENIRKFIRYLLACNLGEVLTMFVASIIGLPMPLLPVQILWVNLVTDGLPAMALGVDPNEANIMNRPPRSPQENLFSRGLTAKIIMRGMQIGFSTIAIFVFVYYVKNDLLLARSMAFSALVIAQIFHAFDCRSEESSAFEVGIWGNKYLMGAAIGSVLMHFIVIYHPFFQKAFSTVPLGLNDWVLVVIVSGFTFILTALKYLFSRRYIARTVWSRVK